MTNERISLGWQLADKDGWSIQGDVNDPFGLNSFSILVEDAVIDARNWLESNPDFKLIEIFDGDIEEPELVDRVNPKAAPAP